MFECVCCFVVCYASRLDLESLAMLSPFSLQALIQGITYFASGHEREGVFDDYLVARRGES